MRVPTSWLRELVDVAASPQDIAKTMSVRGFAVEGIEAGPDPDDAVIDFEVTANRPDAMCMTGMAREIATAYAVELKPAGGATPGVLDAGAPAVPLAVFLDDPSLCPRYVGAVAEVTVAPSPAWMQTRLEAAGIRPISNIVDVTNYVLLELGQPMHAFDAATIAGGEIRVRTAQSGETLKTLDGQTRTLTPEMLVIADAGKATAVAGVMGGADSEVTGRTSTIILEAAYFDPLSVRRTSKALGLKTEASMRFERGADPHLPAQAMQRALELLEQIGAGKGRGALVDRTRVPFGIEPATLRLRRTRIAGILGASVPDADVERILSGLDFSTVRLEDGWRVSAPTRRVDIQREVDLIEEVARHYGLDRLPLTFPALAAAPPPMDPRIPRARQLRGVMTAAGFSEAVTFGFVPEATASAFAQTDRIVPIANPLSETFAVLRPTALAGLVEALAHNRRREQRNVRLFEIGARFSRPDGEERALACVWTGAAALEHWAGGARAVDFFDMKGVVLRLCEAFGLDASIEPVREPWLVPGRAAAVAVGGRRVAVVGQLAQGVTDLFGLAPGEPVYAAEMNLDVAEAARRTEQAVRPLPRYPSVVRDISLLLDDVTPAAEVRRLVHVAAPSTLASVREFDRYQGKGVPEGKVSLSLRLTFRASDRTLTDAEVQTAMDTVIATLRDRLGAAQR